MARAKAWRERSMVPSGCSWSLGCMQEGLEAGGVEEEVSRGFVQQEEESRLSPGGVGSCGRLSERTRSAR